MRKIVFATVVAVAFFISPQWSFSETWLSGDEIDEHMGSCVKEHIVRTVFYTNDADLECDDLMDAGLCQIRTERKGKRVSASIEYTTTSEEIVKYFEVIDTIKRKTQNMGEREKVVFVNDYLQENVVYGGGDQAVDALCRGKAVCGGYAMAFQMIANEIGLKSTVIVGEATTELHAWNEVVVNGRTYGVDTCWGETFADPNNWEQHKKLFEKEL